MARQLQNFELFTLVSHRPPDQHLIAVKPGRQRFIGGFIDVDELQSSIQPQNEGLFVRLRNHFRAFPHNLRHSLKAGYDEFPQLEYGEGLNRIQFPVINE